MTTATTNLFARDDTFFGVCEAIGEDFGFNPNWLRVGFAIPLLYSPQLAIGAYLVVAVIVAISRFAFPRKAAPAAIEGAPVLTPVSVLAVEDAPVYAQAA